MKREPAVQAFKKEDVEVWRADYRQLAATLPRREDGTVCDLLCVDHPYSELTHGGHDRGVTDASDVAAYAAGKVGPYKRSGPSRERERRYARNKEAAGKPRRRTINYAFWTPDDVVEFIETWHPLTRGWIVMMTDDVLMPVHRATYARLGRMAFQPIPFVWPGSSVRLAGDGPSSWTRYLMVSRPRTVEMARWGTLDGAYTTPAGFSEKLPVVGGKPLWLLDRIIEDYSRPGDIVCDPCCGGGTTLVAALRAGRSALGGDISQEHVDITTAQLQSTRARTVSLLSRPEQPRYNPAAQTALFDHPPAEEREERLEYTGQVGILDESSAQPVLDKDGNLVVLSPGSTLTIRNTVPDEG